jgi:hypothetical protein
VNLTDWTTIAATEVASVPRDAEFDSVTFEANAPANAEKVFMRVRAALP